MQGLYGHCTYEPEGCEAVAPSKPGKAILSHFSGKRYFFQAEARGQKRKNGIRFIQRDEVPEIQDFYE